MCEIDNARPQIENRQTAEKSRGWLGFDGIRTKTFAATQAVSFKISNQRNEQKVSEKFEKLSIFFFQKILKINMPTSLTIKKRCYPANHPNPAAYSLA